ncbi:Retinoic acid induced 16-like protein-domain-containing protein [Coniella lustricola]|uniref:Retinoic acid induced 16-like protein-domain-containing protein n=1 Tax=Coniella lustricola TaxID=2025994 RepID=A0A2T3A9B2_9PEZI|nr:Retinoic acid induced 16-like protein-domain-containing protein [Coniella lustricola]
MDFWSRLIANTPLAENARREAARDPVRRLRRFEKEYGRLLQAWRASANLANDYDAAEEVEEQLQELTHILSDETRRPLPHPCIAFSANKQLYLPIAKIATTSYNEWIIKEAVLFFATLVESEEEAFVESEAFANSLTNLLVKITGANSIRLGSDIEARVVELAFNITTKIRLEPEILPAWFKSPRAGPQEERNQDGRDKFEGRAQKQDFPLFYLLVDYIHHEGKIGDFARTGLLYIIEAASNSVELEQWIVESDLSTLMATGLGALYSQLSGKLVIDYPPHDLPPILAFSDYQPPVPTHDIVPSTSPEFQAHLDVFLSHLIFWQDVLNHCKSVDVKSTLLEHFQIIFLQQLLYPSLLESSDMDGGSSVAVLTYLRQILESLDHPDMINLILHYLLGIPDMGAAASEEVSDSVSKARKRKSMDLATMMAAKVDDAADPLLFTLVDLIHACLRSSSPQTIHVTLQLVSAVLKRHHRYAIMTLVRTENIYGEIAHRTIGAQQQELEFLMSLASGIGGQDNFDDVYATILRDTTSRIENHPCSLKLIAPKVSNTNHKFPGAQDSLPGAPRDVRAHTIRADDPLLTTLLGHFELFFLNPVETNLGITETIFDLAACGFMNVEGWLLRSPEKYIYDADDQYRPMSPEAERDDPEDLNVEDLLSEDPNKIDRINHCRRRPVWSTSELPRFLRILQNLSDEIAGFRESIPRFADLLQQRREAFQIADTIPPPSMRNAQTFPYGSPDQGTPHPVPSSITTSRSTSPSRMGGFEGFAQRLLKDLNDLGAPSRAGSPRSQDYGLSGSLGGYGIGTPSSINRPPPVPPKDGPYDTPSRSGQGMARPFTPANGQKLDEDPIMASQAAAFQAIDQQILARKVGISTKKSSEAAPLQLGGKIGEEPQEEEEGQHEDGDQPPPTPAKDDHSKATPTQSSSISQEEEAQANMLSPPRNEPATPPKDKKVSVSHVLTNVIVLQSFLFELAALVQVRAGLFEEVRYV